MRWRRLLDWLCGHRETYAVTLSCGCSREECAACEASQESVCDEHVRLVGYHRLTVGTWR